MPNFAIISYPFVEGDHSPSFACQFAMLVECLSDLHESNIVHGDVRLSNIVFNKEKATATLIDFDFAGMAGDKRYPEGFVTSAEDLGDGARHKNASAGQVLQPEHDWFSLGAVMAFVEPKDDKLRKQWQDVVSQLKAVDVNVDMVKQALKAIREAALVLNGDPPVAPGTGSPPHKDEKSKK